MDFTAKIAPNPIKINTFNQRFYMKTVLLISLLLTSTFLFSQNRDTQQISGAEAKAASARLLGNQNLNTNNYDLKYHRLELNVDPSVAFISGTVTSHFEAKEDMNTITFELVDNMTVSEVTQRGNSLSFSQNADDEVVISLPQMQAMGVLDSLSISYSGNPVNYDFDAFEISTHSGHPILWTLSEPFGAKAWWPCKQDLIDKVDVVDFYITTPTHDPLNAEYVAVANGKELSQTIHGNSKTTHFRHEYPIPAYLIAIAVTNYSVYSHTVENNGEPFPIINYVYPEDLGYAQARTPVTVDIMNLFAEKFEPYPYADEKYGHAQFGWGGGMEHTTVSFMGSLGRGLIAHELGHQWFGNKVTCGSWQDVWLNEGFATYMDGMVYEALDGEEDFNQWKQYQILSATQFPGGSVYIPASDTTSVNRIFSGRLSYDKASMVVHMLRKKLGDTDFFEGLRNYLNDPSLTFGFAKTPDLIRNLEATSGKDLNTFFDAWIYGEGYPSYSVQWNQVNGDRLNVNISQTQSHASVSFFEASVPLRLLGPQGQSSDVLLNNTENDQHFTVPVDFEVTQVLFDPDFDVISKNNNVVLEIEEMSLETQVILYPNPTSAIVKIQKPQGLQIDQVNVYNAVGQLLLQEKYVETLDLFSFSKGIFFIEMETSEGIIRKTILKK